MHYLLDFRPSKSSPAFLSLCLDAALSSSGLLLWGEVRPSPKQDLRVSLWASPWEKEKIKTNRTLISGPLFPLLSCRQKEPSPGRLPQIKASCSPLAASPIRITTTKPAETIIYSFWCRFWSYPTSSTMPTPHLHTLLPSPLLLLAQPLQLSVSFYSQGNKVMPASPQRRLLWRSGSFRLDSFFSYFTPRKVCRLREKLIGCFNQPTPTLLRVSGCKCHVHNVKCCILLKITLNLFCSESCIQSYFNFNYSLKNFKNVQQK